MKPRGTTAPQLAEVGAAVLTAALAHAGEEVAGELVHLLAARFGPAFVHGAVDEWQAQEQAAEAREAATFGPPPATPRK